MKYTLKSPANIAFIKYWGRLDHKIFLPRNNSISMNLSNCSTTTTLELGDFDEDTIEIKFFGKEYAGVKNDSIKTKNIFNQIKRIRKLAGSNQKVKIKSVNNFPADAGIASSASSFSALTGCLLLAYGLDDVFEDKKEFSKEIRLCGSGSAIRSAHDGFVEFLYGEKHDDSYAVQIADHNHWNLVDIVAIVNPEKKLTSSSQGHLLADTSPYFEARIKEMQSRINKVRQAILDKDLKTLGPLIELDSTSMHTIMMTSNPPAYYWGAGSMRLMQDIMEWRREDGLQAYFTLDAGPNVHVICEKKDAKEVERRLKDNEFVKWTIYNEAAEGAKIVDEHLF